MTKCYESERGVELLVYKTKSFSRYQRKEGIGDTALAEAVARAGQGLMTPRGGKS